MVFEKELVMAPQWQKDRYELLINPLEVELSDKEKRYLLWLAGWEQETSEVFMGLFKKLLTSTVQQCPYIDENGRNNLMKKVKGDFYELSLSIEESTNKVSKKQVVEFCERLLEESCEVLETLDSNKDIYYAVSASKALKLHIEKSLLHYTEEIEHDINPSISDLQLKNRKDFIRYVNELSTEMNSYYDNLMAGKLHAAIDRLESVITGFKLCISIAKTGSGSSSETL